MVRRGAQQEDVVALQMNECRCRAIGRRQCFNYIAIERHRSGRTTQFLGDHKGGKARPLYLLPEVRVEAGLGVNILRLQAGVIAHFGDRAQNDVLDIGSWSNSSHGPASIYDAADALVAPSCRIVCIRQFMVLYLLV